MILALQLRNSRGHVQIAIAARCGSLNRSAMPLQRLTR
jgi:hypothetical protein